MTVWLVLTSGVIAIILAAIEGIRVDTEGTFILDWLLAALLLASRIWYDSPGHQRLADACGTIAIVSLGGMACGAIAMLELRLGFPLADETLRSLDHALGFDGIMIVRAMVRTGHWIFWIMAPAYNFAIPIFFASLVLMSWFGNRTEAWRGAFCFVGSLMTTCVIAVVAPAKGLGVWASSKLLNQLPDQAMRSFWPNFDNFYFGTSPVLRMHVVDGVISFPSFHAIVGFLIFAMWRNNPATSIPAGVWLVFMLLGTFPGGGHYVIDLIGGFAVWAAWFVWSRHIEQKSQTADHALPNVLHVMGAPS